MSSVDCPCTSNRSGLVQKHVVTKPSGVTPVQGVTPYRLVEMRTCAQSNAEPPGIATLLSVSIPRRLLFPPRHFIALLGETSIHDVDVSLTRAGPP
jgi:hypothetical protein